MTKQATLYGRTFTMYSEDGNLWVSHLYLFRLIAERKRRVEERNALRPWQRSMVVNWQGEDFYEGF